MSPANTQSPTTLDPDSPPAPRTPVDRPTPPSGADHDPPGLLDAHDVARMLGCSAKHVLRLAVIGVLPAIDISTPGKGRCTWRFHRDSILTWMREQEQPGKRRARGKRS